MLRSGKAAVVPALRVGDVVGAYTVVREIGRGAMATVYEASRGEAKPVALKVLLPEVEQQAELRERFEREGRILQALRHENIARVHEVGALPNGSVYLAIELLEGSDLGTVLDSVGLLAVRTAVQYVLNAARGVAEAHAHGIVHRDLKPANIFLSKIRGGQELVKVVDFGVAKVLGALESERDARQVIGSPHYIAPEQLQGSAAITPRTDVWALGVVLYRALTDTYPFEAGSFQELARKIREAPARPLRDLRPDCPVGLESVIARCLAKDPAARYAHAGELAEALEEFAAEDEEEMTRIQEESTRFMPAARDLQQRSAIASLTGMRATAPASMPPQSVTSFASMSTSVSSLLSTSRSTGATAFSGLSSGSIGVMASSPAGSAPASRAFPWWIAAVVSAVLFLGAGAVVVARVHFAGGPRTVKVHVKSKPVGALFTVDYGAQRVAPGEVTLSRDDRAHILTVWKDGYRPETRDLSARGDSDVVVELAPAR